MMKYTFYEPLAIILIIAATVCSNAFGMEQKVEATSYNSIEGIVINNDTIGQLARKFRLPEEKAPVVRKWMNNNSELIKKMTEFMNVPNSQWLSHMRATKSLLAEQGIDYVGKGDARFDWKSYIAPVPGAEDLFLYASTPFYRLEGYKRYHGHDWNYCNSFTEADKLDTLEKVPTFGTASEVINQRLFEQAAAKNSFNNFSSQRSYLELVNEEQSTDKDNDEGFIAFQERLTTPVVRLFDDKNPQQVQNLIDNNPQAFYELMVATNAIGIWDRNKTLVDEENKLHTMSLRQTDNSNPRFFHNQNLESAAYTSYSNNTKTGFASIYDFCKKHNINEGKVMVREFVRKNVHLPHEAKQKELEQTLEFNN